MNALTVVVVQSVLVPLRTNAHGYLIKWVLPVAMVSRQNKEPAELRARGLPAAMVPAPPPDVAILARTAL